MNHTQLLNYLIEKYNLKSYLEIGVRTTEQNFDKINCEDKVGVDPEVYDSKVFKITSDTFFKYISAVQNVETRKIIRKFDLIFIDGDHTADQVERDFNNSLKCLNDGGFIVLHDTCPDKEEYTKVPRETKIWYGDVYKFAMKLCLLGGINYKTLEEDCGITIVWKDSKVPRCEISEFTWEDYKVLKHVALRIIKPSELDKYLPKVKEAVR